MSAQSLLVKLCLSDSFEHLVHACTICSHHESIALKCMMPEPQGEHAFAAFNVKLAYTAQHTSGCMCAHYAAIALQMQACWYHGRPLWALAQLIVSPADLLAVKKAALTADSGDVCACSLVEGPTVRQTFRLYLLQPADEHFKAVQVCFEQILLVGASTMLVVPLACDNCAHGDTGTV